MADYAHDRTDLTIEEIEKELRKIYGDAEKDLHKKCEDYFRRYKIKDAKKRDQLKRGVITKEDYDWWRYNYPEGEIVKPTLKPLKPSGNTDNSSSNEE